MVRAILDGRKTMTRRVIKPHPNGEIKANIPYEFYGTKTERIFTDTKAYLARYSVGDILWVRETWAKISDWIDVRPEKGIFDGYIYKADWPSSGEHPKWRPSIFMPREAASIFLRVTDVRVERLQDITPEDVQKEGLDAEHPTDEAKEKYSEGSDEMISILNWCKTYSQFIFKNLWDSINAKRGYGWDVNPWVWVISFERCEKP